VSAEPAIVGGPGPVPPRLQRRAPTRVVSPTLARIHEAREQHRTEIAARGMPSRSTLARRLPARPRPSVEEVRGAKPAVTYAQLGRTGLPATHTAMLLFLFGHPDVAWDETRRTWSLPCEEDGKGVSMGQIADYVGRSIRQAERYRWDLEALGLITVEDRRPRFHRFHLWPSKIKVLADEMASWSVLRSRIRDRRHRSEGDFPDDELDTAEAGETPTAPVASEPTPPGAAPAPASPPAPPARMSVEALTAACQELVQPGVSAPSGFEDVVRRARKTLGADDAELLAQLGRIAHAARTCTERHWMFLRGERSRDGTRASQAEFLPSLLRAGKDRKVWNTRVWLAGLHAKGLCTCGRVPPPRDADAPLPPSDEALPWDGDSARGPWALERPAHLSAALWERMLVVLQQRLSHQDMVSWIRPLVLDADGRICAPSRPFRDWVAANYEAMLVEIADTAR
jgi:hypothetical protein